MIKVLVIILAYKNPPIATLASLKNQVDDNKILLDIYIVAAYKSACNVPSHYENVKCIVIKPPRTMREIGERVGFSITTLFRLININKYDYLVKLDDDAYLPRDFFEKNLQQPFIALGAGAAMILNTKYYVRVFGNKWPISALDDFIIMYTIEAIWRAKVYAWRYIRKPVLLRNQISKPQLRRWLKMGFEFYKMGFTTTYMILYTLKRIIFIPKVLNTKSRMYYVLWHMFQLLGYFIAYIFRMKKYYYSPLISMEQKHRLKRGLLRLLSIKSHKLYGLSKSKTG